MSARQRKHWTRANALTFVLALVWSSVAWGTVYFTQPDGHGTSYPLPPTKLIALDEEGGSHTLIGNIKVDGTDVAVEAIALNSTGDLYGFTYSPGVGSKLILINTQDASALAVGYGTPIGEHISGAAFDRDDNLWVFDLGNKTIDRFDVPTLSLDGLQYPIPLPATTNGGDLAFALDGTCYFIGTKNDNSDQPLYTCDVNSGVFTLEGEVRSTGFNNQPDNIFSPAGIAWSLSPITCEPTLIVSDGRMEDEIGVLDLEELLLTQTSTTGVDISWWNHPDLAGFPSIAQVPICDHCGDGVLDPGEECDDGNTEDGDGCSAVCLLEPNQPPEIECLDLVVLWSPNHELVDVSSAISVSDPDGDPVSLTFRVFSDEPEIPDTGDGTGRHAPDFKDELFEGGRGLLVRSERRGREDGRFYAAVITADDGYGGVTEQVCVLAVCPHDQNDPASLDAVLAQADAGVVAIQTALMNNESLPPYGMYEHGLSEPLGPIQ